MKILRSCSFKIPLEPVALKRARIGGAGHMYNPQKNLMCTIGIYISSQFNGPMFDKPIEVSVIFYHKRPKTHLKLKKPPTYMPSTPDLDNEIKLILDASTGVLFKTDAIVCKIVASKEYCTSGEPRTVFTVTELE